uniref:Uncharacterized protein n=1 Tax=Opuntia streptacantha TaxID=393608 RepID=A0A7C9DK71_OPUST
MVSVRPLTLLHTGCTVASYLALLRLLSCHVLPCLSDGYGLVPVQSHMGQWQYGLPKMKMLWNKMGRQIIFWSLMTWWTLWFLLNHLKRGNWRKKNSVPLTTPLRCS